MDGKEIEKHIRKMKQLVIIFIFLSTIKGIAQCTSPITFSIQTTPESCVGCCDGTAQIINLSNVSGCVTSIIWQPTLGTSTYIINLCAGNYSATVSSSCCPPVMMNCLITTNIATAVKDILFNTEINIYPNPNHGTFTVSDRSINENTICKVIDIYGQEKTVISNIDNHCLHLNITDTTQGIYWLELYSNQSVIRKKIIKN